MKKLLVGFLMLGLIFGSVAIMKAADFDGLHFGKDRGYYDRDRSYGDFGSWEASQRDRIHDAYRDRAISRQEFERLNGELNNVNSYHDRVSSKGWISERERDRLSRMEARLDSDIDREINEHRY